MEKYSKVYTKTKYLCNINHITIAKLERDLSFSAGSISKWKYNIPSVDKVLVIANYFNVSLDFITDRTCLLHMAEDILNDKNIIAIQAAREHMTEESKEKMMLVLKSTFQVSFKI